jgi:NADPH:quinone reductase-like Zn-dependent oxidoreductase
VLVRAGAASVNPVEWKYRRGLMDRRLPAVLGSDVSGTVEPSRAAGFGVGDEAFGMVESGAEFATGGGRQAGAQARRLEPRADGGDPEKLRSGPLTGGRDAA